MCWYYQSATLKSRTSKAHRLQVKWLYLLILFIFSDENNWRKIKICITNFSMLYCSALCNCNVFCATYYYILNFFFIYFVHKTSLAPVPKTNTTVQNVSYSVINSFHRLSIQVKMFCKVGAILWSITNILELVLYMGFCIMRVVQLSHAFKNNGGN